jgi:tRNA threonylcarbamoyladenosine biosynthesis protein TsaB
VAVARGGTVLASVRLPEPREHASRVLFAVEATLREAGTRLGDLSGIAVGAGPGSFTGVRVAAATAKGLAHALELPLWAASSLAAAALEALVPPEGERGAGAPREERALYVLFDARADRVYGACYRSAGSGHGVEEVVAPAATSVGRLLSGVLTPGVPFAGSGAVKHAERIRAAGLAVLGPPAGTPTASALLRLLAARGEGPLVDPWRWEPEYLKVEGGW